MKRALLVGINDYPLRPLRGCANDVDMAASYLQEVRGFTATETRKLVDADATGEAIRDGLTWLVAGAAPGDRLYFHYSGHGTLFPVTGPDGRVSALHGAICPVDFDWSHGRPLLDTELRALINQVPLGTEFVYVSDSCYSGELTRAGRWNRPRTLPAPPAITQKIARAQSAGITPQSLGVHDRCALIAGCRADQTSEDDYFDTGFNGALTYYLFGTLRTGTWGGSSLQHLVQEIGSQLQANSYTQQPQLRGPNTLLVKGFLEG